MKQNGCLYKVIDKKIAKLIESNNSFDIFRYKDKDFMKQVTDEYLQERSEYRRTGKAKEQYRKNSSTF